MFDPNSHTTLPVEGMEWEKCYDYFLNSENSNNEKRDIFHQLKCGIIASIGKDVSKVFYLSNSSLNLI
jgi:hypothetical protein